MKALLTLSFLYEVDNREKAEELRDMIDREVWTGLHAAGDIPEFDAVVIVFPASLTIEART